MSDPAAVRGSVVVSLASDVAIAVAKSIVAAMSGSAAMLSEAVHSAADCFNSLFLVFGERSARKPADRTHPAGHGRDAYFWTLMAAMSTFTGGGAISIYEGVVHLVRREMPERSDWTFVVLGVSAVFEGWATLAAYLEHRRDRRARAAGVWASFRATKDLATYAVLFENAAGLLGVAVAFVGIVTSRLTASPYPDAVASLVIGALLAALALAVARESHGLLIGESVEPRVEDDIRLIVKGCGDVEEVLNMLTLQVGPQDVFLAMDVRFRPSLTAAQVVDLVDRIEAAVRARYPFVRRIYIEADRRVTETNT